MIKKKNNMNSIKNEIEIINLAKEGNNKAFEIILKKYKLPIHYMINQMVNNYTLAEDLTMESFEKAFINIRNFTPNYKISTWIYRIAKNHTIDYLKSCNSKLVFVELDTTIKEYYTPEEEMIGKEQANIIENSINNLRGNYKKVMVLRIDGEKYEDISVKLNVPLGSVRGYIRRSKKMIIQNQKKINKEKLKKCH